MTGGERFSKHSVSKAIYGSISVLAVLLVLEEHPPAAWRAAVTLFGSALAIALAEAYSETVAEMISRRVRLTGAAGGRMLVAYEAGLAANWEGLPLPLRSGVLRLAAHLHAGRNGSDPPPAAVSALWRPFRRMAIGGLAGRVIR